MSGPGMDPGVRDPDLRDFSRRAHRTAGMVPLRSECCGLTDEILDMLLGSDLNFVKVLHLDEKANLLTLVLFPTRRSFCIHLCCDLGLDFLELPGKRV